MPVACTFGNMHTARDRVAPDSVRFLRMLWALPLLAGVFFLVEGIKVWTEGSWVFGLIFMVLGAGFISFAYRRRVQS